MRKKLALGFFALLLLVSVVTSDVYRYHNPFLRVDGVVERACRTMPTVHSQLWPPYT
jgi:hypothetical protein